MINESSRKIDFLGVPKDSEKLMLTPPLGPCDPPAFWSKENPEMAPVPEELSQFDSDAPAGMVSIGDGKYVPVGETKRLLDMEGENFGFKVTRRRIMQFDDHSPLVIVDHYH
jgi:hypothetical protein